MYVKKSKRAKGKGRGKREKEKKQMAKRIIVKVDRRMPIDDKNADELGEGYMQMFG